LNYYNEWDDFAAEWLRELIRGGFIPDGEVDTRSIKDVEPQDLAGFSQCHFFAGIGGWSRALQLSGWRPDRPVWTGSPPCQPFSKAAEKRQGKNDERHLWPSFFQLIRKRKPSTVFMEQVATSIKIGWLDEVQKDLETEHYSVGSFVLPASGVGALHRRSRLWIVGKSESERFLLADAIEPRLEGRILWRQNSQREAVNRYSGRCSSIDSEKGFWEQSKEVECRDGKNRIIPTKPELFPLVNGLSARVGTVRGAGNSIVPQAAAEIIKAYMQIDENQK